MNAIRTFLHDAAQLIGGVLRPAVGSVRANIGLAALSVILAFGLWIYVTDAENPEQTRVLPVDITVDPVNTPADVAVANDLAPVRVRIRVEQNVFESLTAADFEGTVDLAGLAVGTYDELEVDVRPLTTRGSLRIEDVLPATIQVKLAQLISKSVPVDVEVNGLPPAGYTMANAEVEESDVDVSGPQEKVDLVTQVVAELDVTGRTESVEQSVRLEPRNSGGSLVQGISIDPAQTQVRIKIEQQTFSRAVAVSPQVTGTPGPGYNVTGVSVNPPTVTISGERGFIEEATIIRTQPIDVNGRGEDLVRTVSLDLPPGATVIGSVTVTVTINITPASGQLLFVVPVSAAGMDDGLGIVGSLPSVQVALFGPLPTLLDLNSNDIVAIINLDGKGVGKHRVEIKVTVPDGLDIRSTSPEQIDITLEQR